MAYDFNAEEIFKLAIRIEENGIRFYQKAASLQSDVSKREMLERLAKMEAHHKKTFESMSKTLSEGEKAQTLFDPKGESSQYLAVMADRHGGEGSPSAADALTGKESMIDIIDIAIDLEKESILFYIGLKDLVPPQYGREEIDHIISEERKHIVLLDAIKKGL